MQTYSQSIYPIIKFTSILLLQLHKYIKINKSFGTGLDAHILYPEIPPKIHKTTEHLDLGLKFNAAWQADIHGHGFATTDTTVTAKVIILYNGISKHPL